MSILNINNLSVEYIGDKSSIEALKNIIKLRYLELEKLKKK